MKAIAELSVMGRALNINVLHWPIVFHFDENEEKSKQLIIPKYRSLERIESKLKRKNREKNREK